MSKIDYTDYTGYRFGRLTVIGKEVNRNYWICKCDCGNTISLLPSRLKKYKSCGCLERENRKALKDKMTTHGMTNTRLYGIWQGIKYRCYNPKCEHFDRYGGRGIRLCEEWENSFDSFFEWSKSNGYDDGLTIDRVDVDGDYSPKNCRWISMKEQARNKSNTLLISVNGEKISARKFAEDNNIPDFVFVFRRVKKGDSAERIIYDWNMIHNTPKDYMSVKQASQYYCVHEETIKKWIKKGKLNAERCGNRIFIHV